MDNKKRVLTVLNHEQPDKIPYNIVFTQKAHAKMAEFYNDPDYVSKLGNCFININTAPQDGWRQITSDIAEDQFGVQWDRTVDKDIGVVCNCLINPDNIDEYVFPDPDEPSTYENYNNVIQSNPDGFFISDIGFSLFERAWTLAGMENILMAMADNKDFANKLMDKILEFNLKVIENAASFNIDAMMFGDDWGQQRGLIMGPVLWREFIKPRIKEMYSAVKRKGKYVFIHSCGNIKEILPDLIECGLDLFNPFQPEVMDVYSVKKKYGQVLSFYGGISTQRLLPFGTASQVKEEVLRLMDKIGFCGGYIAAPAHAIPADAKPENIATMIEILKNQK